MSDDTELLDAINLLTPVPCELRQVSRWLSLVEPTIGILREWLIVQSRSESPDQHAMEIARTIVSKDADRREEDQRYSEELQRLQQARREEDARPPAYTGQVWRGHWPLRPQDAYPPKGCPVVYWLYATPGKPAYIGSSGQFLARMDRHDRDKTWTQWTAKECSTRLAAYRLEAIEIDKDQPPLNRPQTNHRRGRDYVQSELRRKGAVR